MRALVWFRNDLRVTDNPALHAACRRAEDVVFGVFLVCARQWRNHDWGAPKVDFILRSVGELSRELATLGIPLRIASASRFSAAPRVLLEVAREQRVDTLFFNREYEVNEIDRDRRVRQRCAEHDIEVHEFHDQTVLPPDLLRTKTGSPFKVFTPFKRAWLARVDATGLPEPCPRPRRRGRMPAPPDAVPERLDGFPAVDRVVQCWPAGEAAAARRLDRFLDGRIERYHEDRDRPALDGTSSLSPYLASGALSARQCLAGAVDVNTGWLEAGRPGPTTWISELIWREFYRHVLVGFPRVSRNRAFKPQTERLPWVDDAAQFERWCAGRTGVPIVDAAMRQLNRTGWMHNRLRMIAAMYLSKSLFIDWRRGERHFMQTLVDGDLANNNGGWQWSASTGCDAAPYFRMFNPISQSRRWDPDGGFIRRYCPELAELDDKQIHDPSTVAPLERAALDYPPPLVDHATSRRRVMRAFERLRA